MTGLPNLAKKTVTDFSVDVIVRGKLLLDAADKLGLPAADVLEMTRAHLQCEQRRVLENPKLLRKWAASWKDHCGRPT